MAEYHRVDSACAGVTADVAPFAAAVGGVVPVEEWAALTAKAVSDFQKDRFVGRVAYIGFKKVAKRKEK